MSPAACSITPNKSTEVDDLFCLYEVYADEDALVAHRATPHFAEIIEGQIVPVAGEA